MSLLSKGLSFSPTLHFDLFQTILDINKFIRNVTVRRHFSGSDFANTECGDNTNDVCEYNVNTVGDNINTNAITSMPTMNCLFHEQRLLAELHTLQAESVESRTNQVATKFKVHSPYFYPVQSRTMSMDRFHDAIIRELIEFHQSIDIGATKNNLKNAERMALHDLGENK